MIDDIYNIYQDRPFNDARYCLDLKLFYTNNFEITSEVASASCLVLYVWPKGLSY